MLISKACSNLKVRCNALSKAEATKRKKSKQKKAHNRFFNGPFQFAKALFEQPKSRTLTLDKDTLEQHLRKFYSEQKDSTPLNIPGLVNPGSPTKPFNVNPPTFEEVEKVV